MDDGATTRPNQEPQRRPHLAGDVRTFAALGILLGRTQAATPPSVGGGCTQRDNLAGCDRVELVGAAD